MLLAISQGSKKPVIGDRPVKTLRWLASFPKSGNTWARLFFSVYLTDDGAAPDLSKSLPFSDTEIRRDRYTEVAKKSSIGLTPTPEEIEKLRRPVQAQMARTIGNRRVIKTHSAFCKPNGTQLIWPEYMQGAVYLVRNPLDIVDSFADHNNMTHDRAIDDMGRNNHHTRRTQRHVIQYLGSWSHHVTSWTKRPDIPVHVCRYEDLLQAPADEFRRMIAAFGWEVDEGRLRRAVEVTAFDQLQESEQAGGFTETNSAARSRRFFRHGTSGNWRDILSPDQIARVVDRHGDAMRKMGYPTNVAVSA